MIGGLGASLLLPAMQSLIHGNFEGAAQEKVYALVGAAAAIAAAVGPLLGGFITTYLSWRVGVPPRGRDHRDRARRAVGLVHDVPYTGSREVDVVGAVLSVARHGRHRARHPRVAGGRRGRRGAARSVGGVALGFARVLARAAQARGQADAARPGPVPIEVLPARDLRPDAPADRARAALMIALPIFLQMVLEYNAMQAGLSLAPLSLTHVRGGDARGEASGPSAPEQDHPAGVRPARRSASSSLIPIVPRADSGWDLVVPLVIAGSGLGPARLPAQQLHALADRRGARQRGRRRELGGWLVRSVVRPRLRRRDHAGVALARRSPTWQTSSDVLCPAEQQQVAEGLEEDAEVMSNTQLRSCSPASPQDVQDEIVRINTDARQSPCRWRCSFPCSPDSSAWSPGSA